MKSSRDLVAAASILLALLSIVAVSFAMKGEGFWTSKVVGWLAGSIFGALIAIYLSHIISTFNKNPTPLKVALIGEPGSGKTVFLSVLFNELLVSSNPKVAFAPYGRETIEAVSRNMGILMSGDWLRPTVPGNSLFTFRANVTLRFGLLPKRYTIEIGDFAGEHLGEFDPSSEQWLHRTEYFKYAVAADAIFLVVDAGRIWKTPRPKIDAMQQRLIAALQVLIDEKGVSPESGLKEPVALIVTKADLLGESGWTKEEVIEELQQTVRVCRRLCREFDVFLVSAVGSVNVDGSPPEKIKPTNITDPMMWALRRLRI